MKTTSARFVATTAAILQGFLGQTVFAESGESRPEARPDVTPAPKVAYEKGRGLWFRSESEGFLMRISLRSQLRIESFRPTEDGQEFSSRFYVPRARLQIEGNLFGAENRYKVEIGLYDRGSFSFVKDIWIERALFDSGAHVRLGQWKRPFNRHELVSDFTSEFNERSHTAEFVGGGRDVGIAIHNDYEKSPEGLEWALGVFNRFAGGSDRPVIPTTCVLVDPVTMEIDCTSGAPTNVPADFGPTIVAHAGFNMGGIKGYSEGDLEGGPLRLAVGLSYKVDLANLSKGTESSTSKNMSHGLEADAMIKVAGLDVLVGAYLMKIKSADWEFAPLVQAGYFLLPKKAQVAGRFSYVPVGDRKQLEIRGAFNWYWVGHAFKWATDAGVVMLTGEDPVTMETDKPDVQLRSMAQFTF